MICSAFGLLAGDWQAVGGTHCQIGMLAIAGYLHSARGRKLQMYDAALFAVYMGFRWVFPWIFYWMLGEWSHPAQFAVPRWFLLAILESRLVLAGTEALRTNLPSKYKFLAGTPDGQPTSLPERASE